MRKVSSFLLLALATPLLAPRVSVAGERAALDLGSWETARAPRDGKPGKFSKSAPALPFAPGQEDVLARCVFDLPAALASCALCVELERVRWDASVAIDGQEIAKGLEGAASLDLPRLEAGKHELLVRAHDLRAASAFTKRTADDDPEGAWIAPVGRAPRLAGVLGAARIAERLGVEVRGASCKGGVLELELRGRTGEPCEVGFVFSGSAETKKVSPGRDELTTLALPWPARAGVVAEVAIVVSGCVERRTALVDRKVEVKKGELLVGGAPFFFALLDAPLEAKDAIERAHLLGATVLATGGARPDAWFDAVEKAGLHVLVESDASPTPSSNALEDERFWKNLEHELKETVTRLRGRPCVLGWSVARALLREGAGASPRVRARLAALAELVRSLDPTRPVALVGDDGRALGYDLAWSATPGPGVVATLPPVEPPQDLAARLALAGDPGFLYPVVVKVEHEKARARAIRAARVAGALGVDLGACSLDPSIVDALAPVTLLADPWRGGGELARRPFERRIRAAGGEVAFAWSLTLAGKVVASGAGRGAILDVRATPPAVKDRTVAYLDVSAVSTTTGAPHGPASLDLPVVVWPERLEPLAEHVVLVEGPDAATGEALLAAGVAWRDAPALPEHLERGTTLVIGEGALDEKATRPRLVALVERARRIGCGILVLRQSLPLPDGVGPALAGFDPRGARELVFRDSLDRLAADMTSEDLAGWPGVEGALPPPALERPLRADARVLVEGGPLGLDDAVGVVSLDDDSELVCQVPLAQRRDVPAARALLRALVRGAAERRPSAERPFFARVDAELEGELGTLGLVARPWSLDALESAGAPVIVLDDSKAALTERERACLERVVAAGATLLARLPDDASIARLGSLAPAGARVEKTTALPAPGPLAGLRASDLFWAPAPGGFRDFTSRFDSAPRALHADDVVALVRPGALVERPFGRGRVILDLIRWREGVAAKIPAARRWIAQLLAELGAERHEPPIHLPVQAWGGIGREGDHVMFYGNGTASARFVAQHAGRYTVEIELAGSKCREGYPTARVVCDARHLGDVAVEGPTYRSYALEVTIPAGVHTLSVSFTNDAYAAPEDRNMMLRGAVMKLVAGRVY
jgi:hypothetical protein